MYVCRIYILKQTRNDEAMVVLRFSRDTKGCLTGGDNSALGEEEEGDGHTHG